MKTKIITGLYKGRVLQLPPAEAARPTRNRIVQAAFNILQGYTDWQGAHVLELCCGSGAWGLEALSRGAEAVVLVDTAPQTARANVAALGVAGHVQVVGADAARYRPSAPFAGPFDVVLADPPYADTRLVAAILANAPHWGKSGSVWMIETAVGVAPEWPQGFTQPQTRPYGTTALHVAVWEG